MEQKNFYLDVLALAKCSDGEKRNESENEEE